MHKRYKKYKSHAWGVLLKLCRACGHFDTLHLQSRAYSNTASVIMLEEPLAVLGEIWAVLQPSSRGSTAELTL